MTESELVEAITGYLAAAQTGGSTLISLLSAYLIVAYLAGDKLTRSQVLVVTALYIYVTLGTVIGAFGSLSKARHYAAELKALNPNEVIYLTEYIAGLSVVGAVACLSASLWFMWSIRHPKTE
jgi:hypothetical protein